MRSGREYATPMWAVPATEGNVVSLPFGEGADWLKNVLAAGQATIENEGTTRLLLRERSGLKPRMRDVLLNYLFIERQHFVMVRRMLLGIKERAERAQAARSGKDEKLTWEPGRTLLAEVLPEDRKSVV